MKTLGPGATVVGRFDGRRRAIDSLPGPGFDTIPWLRRSCRRPEGHGRRSGGCDRSGAEQRIPRRECRLEGRRPGAVDAGGRFVVTGMSEPGLRRLMQSLALQTGRLSSAGAGATAHRPLPALERQHRRRLDTVATRKLRFRVLRHPAPTSKAGSKESMCSSGGREHAIDHRRIPNGIGAAAVSRMAPTALKRSISSSEMARSSA